MKKSEKNTLGKIIQKNREKQGISKVKLCRGLCTITALTRYEEDTRIPDKFLTDALLERLGINSFRYEFIVSDQEFHYNLKRLKFERLFAHEKWNEAKELLYEYESEIEEKDFLHWQYILSKKAIFLEKEEKYKEAIPILYKALEYTKCNAIPFEKLENTLFTNIEIELLYLLAKCQSFLGETKQAYLLFHMLKHYMDTKSWDREKLKDYYPNILYGLAQHELETHNFGKAFEYLNEAETLLKENYLLSNLEEIIRLKTEIGTKIGIVQDAKEKEQFILALNLISTSEKGKITKEGICLWENTINQQ